MNTVRVTMQAHCCVTKELFSRVIYGRHRVRHVTMTSAGPSGRSNILLIVKMTRGTEQR